MFIPFASIALILVVPPACVALSFAAFARAADQSARATRSVLRTWTMLGTILISLLFVLVGRFVAPNPVSSTRDFESDRDMVWYFVLEAAAVLTPIVLSATWFRRVAPSREARVLMTVVAIGSGVWLALADLWLRAMSGI